MEWKIPGLKKVLSTVNLVAFLLLVFGAHVLANGIDLQANGRKFDMSNSQQQRTVTGVVTDSSEKPLPGAAVVLKGTTQGTITDLDGKYSLSDVPADGVLVFSFVGMKSQEISIGGKTSINVMLQEGTIGLDEVVAIGYGTQKKSDLTGSVGTVTSGEMKSLTVANPTEALQGRIAGSKTYNQMVVAPDIIRVLLSEVLVR